MSAVLTPNQTDTDPATSIERAVSPAYPDAPMFGPPDGNSFSCGEPSLFFVPKPASNKPVLRLPEIPTASPGFPVSAIENGRFSSTDGMAEEQALIETAESAKRDIFLARLRGLVRDAAKHTEQARTTSDVYDWDGTRRMVAECLEHVTRRLLPDFDGDSADIAKAVMEDL